MNYNINNNRDNLPQQVIINNQNENNLNNTNNNMYNKNNMNDYNHIKYNNNMCDNMNNYNVKKQDNIKDSKSEDNLMDVMSEDYQKIWPKGHSLEHDKLNIIIKMMDEYTLIEEDIIKEIESCDPEKSEKNNPELYNIWKNSSYEQKLYLRDKLLEQKIHAYLKENINKRRSYIYNLLKRRYDYDRKNNYYIKKYKLNDAEYLELRLINSILFYTCLRLFSEGEILEKVLQFDINYLLSSDIEMAKLALTNEKLWNIPPDINLCKKFKEIFHKAAEFTRVNAEINLKNKIGYVDPQQNFNNNQNFDYNSQSINMNYNDDFLNNQQMMSIETKKNIQFGKKKDQQICEDILNERSQIENPMVHNEKEQAKIYYKKCIELLKPIYEKKQIAKKMLNVYIYENYEQIKNILDLGYCFYKQLENFPEKCEEDERIMREIKDNFMKIYVLLTFLNESENLGSNYSVFMPIEDIETVESFDADFLRMLNKLKNKNDEIIIKISTTPLFSS